MLPREKEKTKPQLAQANQPFTPMTHKSNRAAETPYQPLRVDDLATPKMNKSHSVSSRESSEIVRTDTDPEDEWTSEIKSIRQAAASIQLALDRLERKRVRRQKPRKTFSVGTQTGLIIEKKNPEKSADLTEVSLSDHSGPSDASPVGKLNGKRGERERQKPKHFMRQEDSDGKMRVRLSPTSKPRPSFETPEASDPLKRRVASVSSSPVSGDDLQKRLHDMSILLKRLEYQLDDLNQT
jgi:hypothetical protein